MGTGKRPFKYRAVFQEKGPASHLILSLILFVQACSIPFLLLCIKPDWQITCKSAYSSCHQITNLYILHQDWFFFKSNLFPAANVHHAFGGGGGKWVKARFGRSPELKNCNHCCYSVLYKSDFILKSPCRKLQQLASIEHMLTLRNWIFVFKPYSLHETETSNCVQT